MNRKQRRAQGGGKAASAAGDARLVEAVGLHRSGRLEEAEALYRRILGKQPRHAAALHLLGVAAAQQGRLDEAAGRIGAALDIDAGNADAHSDLGNVLRGLGRDDEAVRAYQAAVSLRPEHAQAWLNLGLLLAAQRRFEAAAESLGRAADLDPANPIAPLQQGVVLHELGRTGEAIAAFEVARRRDPRRPEPSCNLAIALREVGRTSEALAATDMALAANPASARAWHIRSDLKRFAPGDPDLAAMQALLGDASARSLDLDGQIQLEFALGKAWRDAGETDRAFQHLAAGARLRRASFTYDVEIDAGRIEAYAAALSAETFEQLAGGGLVDERPVFIVGMPRSGTTLVEQILAAHSEVASLGETPRLAEAIGAAVGAPHPLVTAQEFERLLAPEPLSAAARRYLSNLPDARRVLDKTPANFQFSGVIALALPGARIIHCRRDAADTCFSCFATLFTGDQPFTYDLAELGRFHQAYETATSRWRALLPPERFFEIDYEALVADLEGQSRRLVEFCGLGWEAACLDFNRSARPVRTASATQVRQPAYSSSVGAHRPFAAHLGPLLSALAEVRR